MNLKAKKQKSFKEKFYGFINSITGKATAGAVTAGATAGTWYGVTQAQIPGIENDLKAQYLAEINFPGYSFEEIKQMLQDSIQYNLPNKDFAIEYLDKFNNIPTDAFNQAATSLPSIGGACAVLAALVGTYLVLNHQAKKALQVSNTKSAKVSKGREK